MDYDPEEFPTFYNIGHFFHDRPPVEWLPGKAGIKIRKNCLSFSSRMLNELETLRFPSKDLP